MTSPLEVLVEGNGPRVVLVHGSVMGADVLWMAQAPLAERWTLVKPNRQGFGNSQPAEGEDWERDADDVAALIEDGDHVVGHSYGGVVSLLAAAQRRDAVRSLTVLEPPAMDVARGDDVVEDAINWLAETRKSLAEDLDAFLRAFAGWVGSTSPLPDPLPPQLLHTARLLFNQRRPEDAHVPSDELRAAPFRKLVVSGDGHPVLGHVCDVLKRELDAESAYIGGVGHSIPFAGPPFNDTLEAFWTKAS